MKKLFFAILSFLLLTPVFASAQIVPCNGPDCTISSFFQMLVNIFTFLIWWIAAPLSVLMLTIGGVMLMISAGNPNLAGIGKKTLYAAIIGLALAFGSWLIINFIVTAMGGNANWFRL